MDRREINTEANNWILQDEQHRAGFNIGCEVDSEGENRLSLAAGGNANLLLNAILSAMKLNPGLYTILKEAVDEFPQFN
jgi:hypothetical protein